MHCAIGTTTAIKTLILVVMCPTVNRRSIHGRGICTLRQTKTHLLKLNYNGGSRQVTTTTERVIDSLFIQWQKINP